MSRRPGERRHVRDRVASRHDHGVGAGPGSKPFYIDGSVSLTGGYKGAPFGLSVAVRAIAGPFDLGMVVVRQAIFVDPIDAHITVMSDPLPDDRQGRPAADALDQRRRQPARLHDQPDLVRAKQIKATLASTDGCRPRGDAALPGRRLARRCRSSRSCAMRLTGRGQTTDGKHPGLRAVLTQGAGPGEPAGRRSGCRCRWRSIRTTRSRTTSASSRRASGSTARRARSSGMRWPTRQC